MYLITNVSYTSGHFCKGSQQTVKVAKAAKKHLGQVAAAEWGSESPRIERLRVDEAWVSKFEIWYLRL